MIKFYHIIVFVYVGDVWHNSYLLTFLCFLVWVFFFFLILCIFDKFIDWLIRINERKNFFFVIFQVRNTATKQVLIINFFLIMRFGLIFFQYTVVFDYVFFIIKIYFNWGTIFLKKLINENSFFFLKLFLLLLFLFILFIYFFIFQSIDQTERI